MHARPLDQTNEALQKDYSVQELLFLKFTFEYFKTGYVYILF